uniref:Uncharacterized protein n=1 Tax=Chlamydomonas leiostraca TaxID=1034604 RepID=A0A7S0RKD5_9CHLO|mmetsp:Transcript_24300/g.61823  ORF Transcript_24300/g.61823 Transcript_24300/m.61823 type:complete len:555 (+) Transcript_24300:57-1721(+)
MAPKAKPPQPEHEEDEEHSDEIEDDEHESTAADNNSQGGPGGKKKKKKKKKGKKKASGEATDGSSPAASSAPTGPQVNKAEADKKFNAAISSIKGNDEMWVKLNACAVQDGKAKKLFDQLKSNSTVTSLDLSQNQLTDEAAQTIASILGMNGAPELIELDLRENSFSQTGLQVLEGLKKVRKLLDIKTGSIKAPEPAASGKKQADSTSGSKELKDMSRGPMFRKFFQSGNDDDDDPGMAEVPETSVDPDELWSKIDSLTEGGQASIPALLPHLQQLSMVLQRELSTMGGPNQDAMDGSRPHIKACLNHLHTLEELVALEPRDVTVQYSSSPQPAVGSHRVWTAEVIAALLSAGNKVIDGLLAASKLPQRLLHLALHRPLCSTLHTRALRMLRSMLSSKVEGLVTPLFLSGWGASLKAGGSDALCAPLPDLLIDRSAPALGVVSGQRSAGMGLVLEAAKALVAACDDANTTTFSALVRRSLLASSRWSEYVDADPYSGPGAYVQLTNEQEGDLGGPRAVRSLMNGGASELADLAGGGLMTGQEILALLQGMSVAS